MAKVITAARRAGLNVPGECRRLSAEEIERALLLTYDPEPRVRQAALMNLCPCHLQQDRADVWDRVFELATDSDVGVRKQVVHTLADGSPRRLRERAVATLQSMRLDSDDVLRRGVRRILAHYRNTGRIAFR